MNLHAFDINEIPQNTAFPPIDIQNPTMFTLLNGLELLVIENHQVPLVEMKLLIDNPPFLPSKAGVTTLTNMLFGRQSTTKNYEQLSQEVEHLGASMHLNINGGGFQVLSKHFEKLMELFASAALYPKFLEDDLHTQKQKLIQSIKARENNAEDVAQRVADFLIYTPKHPYGLFSTENSVQSIELADVISLYHQNFTPDRAYMVIMGSISPTDAFLIVSKLFSSWKRQNASPLALELFVPRNVKATEINFIDMPQAVQVVLGLYRLVNFSLNSTDYFAAILMNYILGGGFSSYINMNLREKNAFTYGASSSLETNRYTKGIFSVHAKVHTASVGSAVKEILNEVQRIQTSLVSPTELSRAKGYYLGNFIMSFEKYTTLARLALNLKLNKLPANFYYYYTQRISNVTAEEICSVAQKYININELRIVIAGAAQHISPQLEDLKWDNMPIAVHHYDKSGAAIAS